MKKLDKKAVSYAVLKEAIHASQEGKLRSLYIWHLKRLVGKKNAAKLDKVF
jgi:hypothetical protein